VPFLIFSKFLASHSKNDEIMSSCVCYGEREREREREMEREREREREREKKREKDIKKKT